MSSKSLPSNFKQSNYRIQAISSSNNYNASSISRETISESQQNQLYPPSFNSSNVKASSPLTQLPWLSSGPLTDSSGTMSDKSWMTRRWSTLSGSLAARRQKIRKKTKNSWKNRQKRRTFPPSQVILAKDRKKFSNLWRDNKSRHSLQEILSQFNEHNSASSTRSSSSSLSKRLSKLLKKKGKQPYRNKKKRPPSLFISNDETLAQKNTLVYFQPPTTISSQSTNKTPVKFPTPPKRFSAHYIDLEGNVGKVDYKKPRNRRKRATVMIKKYFTRKNQDDMSYYRQQTVINLSLFIFGFLFFPCWWVGALLYIVRKKDYLIVLKRKYFVHEFDLISIHTFGYLNSIFTCLSFILITLIVALLMTSEARK